MKSVPKGFSQAVAIGLHNSKIMLTTIPMESDSEKESDVWALTLEELEKEAPSEPDLKQRWPYLAASERAYKAPLTRKASDLVVFAEEPLATALRDTGALGTHSPRTLARVRHPVKVYQAQVLYAKAARPNLLHLLVAWDGSGNLHGYTCCESFTVWWAE